MFAYLHSVRREFSRIRWLSVKKATVFSVLVLVAFVGVGFLIKLIDGVILFVVDTFTSL